VPPTGYAWSRSLVLLVRSMLPARSNPSPAGRRRRGGLRTQAGGSPGSADQHPREPDDQRRASSDGAAASKSTLRRSPVSGQQGRAADHHGNVGHRHPGPARIATSSDTRWERRRPSRGLVALKGACAEEDGAPRRWPPGRPGPLMTGLRGAVHRRPDGQGQRRARNDPLRPGYSVNLFVKRIPRRSAVFEPPYERRSLLSWP
jgi:hypothetical protein